jgi:hypothetical protein
MKRLGAWDAVLLCTETSNVHTHTLESTRKQGPICELSVLESTLAQ